MTRTTPQPIPQSRAVVLHRTTSAPLRRKTVTPHLVVEMARAIAFLVFMHGTAFIVALAVVLFVATGGLATIHATPAVPMSPLHRR